MSPAADSLTLRRADDFHVHVRQHELMRTVTPMLRLGGIARCLVMPNTQPPITTLSQAITYRAELNDLAPGIEFLMSLYLTPDMATTTIHGAAEAGIAGVKLYPRGVTTHSDEGIDDLEPIYPVFKAMEETGMVLEIHAESPSDHARDICVLNADEDFLPKVGRLHADFPSLRIVFEHVTSAAAVSLVRLLGDTVAATITAHHLDLTVDDWAGKNHNFCKPVAKFPHDRDALRAVVAEGHPRFFLGSDSAPHPVGMKECAEGCAGVFTSPLLLPYLADTFDRLGILDRLEPFVSEFGSKFYDTRPNEETVTLVRREQQVPGTYGPIVPYRAGEKLAWSV
jgi:dihydroorotase